jgi:hypothetical protein
MLIILMSGFGEGADLVSILSLALAAHLLPSAIERAMTTDLTADSSLTLMFLKVPIGIRSYHTHDPAPIGTAFDNAMICNSIDSISNHTRLWE